MSNIEKTDLGRIFFISRKIRKKMRNERLKGRIRWYMNVTVNKRSISQHTTFPPTPIKGP